MNRNHIKSVLLGLIVLSVLVTVGLLSANAFRKSDTQTDEIDSFVECAEAGNPIMESYPERCSAGGRTFTNPDQKVINP